MKIQHALKIRKQSLAVILFVVLPFLGIGSAKSDSRSAGHEFSRNYLGGNQGYPLDYHFRRDRETAAFKLPVAPCLGDGIKLEMWWNFHAITSEGRGDYRCTINGDVCYGTATGQEFRGILSLRRKK